jgi:type II secretory pathway component GspD/PulD (secretin)
VRLTNEVEDLRGQLKGKRPAAAEEPSTKVFALRYTAAADATRALRETLGQEEAKRVEITYDDATNSLVVRALRAQDLERVAALIARMEAPEKPKTGAPVLLRSITVKRDAAGVARALEAEFKDTKVRVTAVGGQNVVIYGTPEEIEAALTVIKKLEDAAPAPATPEPGRGEPLRGDEQGVP